MVGAYSQELWSKIVIDRNSGRLGSKDMVTVGWRGIERGLGEREIEELDCGIEGDRERSVG